MVCGIKLLMKPVVKPTDRYVGRSGVSEADLRIIQVLCGIFAGNCPDRQVKAALYQITQEVDEGEVIDGRTTVPGLTSVGLFLVESH
jgi:hypothetical protein